MGEGRAIMVLAALQNGLRCLDKFLIHWGLSVLLRGRGGGRIINSHSRNVAVGECKNVCGGKENDPPSLWAVSSFWVKPQPPAGFRAAGSKSI